MNVYIYRNEGAAIFRELFKTEIYLNDTFICKLKDRNKIKLSLPINKSYVLSINNNIKLKLETSPRNIFLKVSKFMSSSSMYSPQGNTIGISIGDVYFEEKDEMLYKIESLHLKRLSIKK